MADGGIKNKANIGSSSLILIFIVLCLATFGLLSLTSASNDWDLAAKNAAAVQSYYKADSQGEEFVQMVDEVLCQTVSGQDRNVTGRMLKQQLGEYYHEDTGMIITEIPMEYGQALHIELAVASDREKRYEIEAWKVINLEDYDIDRSMPVWTGK